MNAFTRLFTTDLVANDCRVFDWVAAVNKKMMMFLPEVLLFVNVYKITNTAVTTQFVYYTIGSVSMLVLALSTV